MIIPINDTSGLGFLPGVDLQFMVESLVVVFLTSLRIGAFLIASPFFGGTSVPIQARILLAILLGISVFSVVPAPDLKSFEALSIFRVIIVELTIGIAAGLILTIWFSAALLAGEKIASSAGLGFAAQVDPDSGGQTPVVSKTLSLFLTVIFLSWDGHLLVLRAVADSYGFLPIGATPDFYELIKGGVSAAGYMFIAAAIIMLPLTMFLMATNLVIGVITRSAPQLNLFSFGFPISMLAIFILFYLWVGSLGSALDELSRSSVEDLMTILGGALNG